jgi:RNA polymerase sigma-70 factor, ECF subfamily
VTLHREDRELVARMLGGEEPAFSEFVDRYSKALYRFSLQRLDGDRELTRDTVQTAITKALANLDTYRGEASLLTWLCACCRNEILMQRRRRRTAPALVELEEGVEPAAGSTKQESEDPEAALLRRESARLVHRTLDLLLPRQAQALEWKYVDQLPVDEIAARLGVRPKAAESLLTRARDAFRSRYQSVLADRGVDGAAVDREPRSEPAGMTILNDPPERARP